MKKFEFIEGVTMADVCFKAYGSTLKEVFENAGLALQDVQVDAEDLKEIKKTKFTVKGDDRETLLFRFLNKLVYYKDTDSLFFKKLSVEFKDGELRATCEGQKLNPQRDPIKIDVKAVTLHEFYLRETETGWECQVVLDI